MQKHSFLFKNVRVEGTRDARLRMSAGRLCKTWPLIKDSVSSCTFENTGQNHLIKQKTITCTSKDLIYMHDTISQK